MATGKIPLLDLMFFLTETPGSPKHVGAVQIFELPQDAPADYMRDLVAALRRAQVASPFNYRPHFPRVGLPEWRVDDDLDIEYHVRHSALPAPGTDGQLLEVLQRLHCGLLSRDRPVWICQVIEGLEGGRFAIYSKIHHAYIDGMSGVMRMFGSLSSSPEDADVEPVWSYVPRRASGSGSRSGVMSRLETTGRTLTGQLRAMVQLYGSIGKKGLEMLQNRQGGSQPMFNAPRTRMNRRVEYDTRSLANCTLALDTARSIGRKSGATVNDVILTIVDAALHDYLETKGENTDSPLVALCPMSTREEGDDAATTQATILQVRMGMPGASIGERLRQVKESSTASKKDANTLSREAHLDATLIKYGVLELLERTGLGRVLLPTYNVLVSNVPGPREDTLYLRGSRQLAVYPISGFLPGGNINITVISHGKNIDFGLVADKHALPDLQFIVQSMKRRFAELQRATLRNKTGRAQRVAG